jgi:endonuclease/exonuclease/phosphatase family metal-dependent hydrolase
LASVLHSFDADIIGLQEVRLQCDGGGSVCRSQIDDLLQQMNEVARLLNTEPVHFQFLYQPAMTYLQFAQGLPFDQEGVALLTRWPIVSRSHLVLTKNFSDADDYHQRVCLQASVNVGGVGIVSVFVAHFTLSDRARTRTVGELAQWMRQFPAPRVLLTDFNANADSEAMRQLLADPTLALQDAWRCRRSSLLQQCAKTNVAVDGDDSDNDSHAARWTFTTLEKSPKKRIDFVLFGNGGGGIDEPAARPSLVLNDRRLSSGNETASDHRALYAEFRLVTSDANL